MSDRDAYGAPLRQVEAARVDGMRFTVCCAHCGGIYDYATVEVTDRDDDCSVWNAPCCGRQVDDRLLKQRVDFYPMKRRS